LAADPIQYGGMASKGKVGYPSDVSDEEWAFVLPYLLLSREDSAHREHDLRAVFNGVRYIARTGNQWRFMPHDYPPWPAIYQQMQRWMRAGCFERLVEDTRILLREFAGRKGQPTAACIDSRTLQSTPESGARAGYDGAKRRKGSKVHIAVDTLGHLLALSVTPADQGDRAQVETLAQDMQRVTGGTVEMAYVDQGYTGPIVAEAAQSHGIRLEVVKHPMAKRGFLLLPRRWVVERSFAWAARFRRLVRDYERLDTTLKGFHYVAFACLMIANMFKQLA
jgi:transposase